MTGKDGKKYRKRTLKKGVVYEVLIDGKWKSTGQTTIERAITWAKKYQAEPKEQDLLLKQFARDFYRPESQAMQRLALRGKQKSSGWYIQSQARLESYILPYFGDFYLTEISPLVVDDWLLHLKSHQGKKLSAASKNKIITCLKRVLQEAVTQGLLERNPMDGLVVFTERDKERKIFTDKELALLFPEDDDALLQIWGSVLWACYFLVLRDTGHRMGEQAVLTWGDLFAENGQYGFTITKSMDWYTKEVKPGTKTGYSRATLISERAYRLLMRHKEQQACDLIFSLDGRRGIISESARKHLMFAAKNAGIELNGRTPYCFRHTANTNLLLNVNPTQVRFLMGHRTEKETTNYNHPDRRLLIKKATQTKAD